MIQKPKSLETAEKILRATYGRKPTKKETMDFWLTVEAVRAAQETTMLISQNHQRLSEEK